MKVEKIDLEKTGAFSLFFLDYISQNKKLAPFYGEKPTLKSFAGQMAKKQFSKEKRQILHEVLADQYGSQVRPEVRQQIDQLLLPDTYTVTTGHQLNIFTGPLYFIYKIATVINACKALKESYPDKHFVPVYWMASEDHDFDEISYFHLFGKKYQWKTDQKGAVGRFSPEGLQGVIGDLPEKVALFEEAYTQNETLAGAVRQYVDGLFGADGVVVLDADDRRLKAQFAEVILDDLTNHHANDLVEETSARLGELGYSAQVFPRAINFFYLDGGTRERIVKESGEWKVLQTDLAFSEEQIQALVKNEPEKLSPNVVMRPLYQEVILPNLAYAGGPAEVVYWMQLKEVFEHYQVPFPILMPRNFGLYVNGASLKKMDKLGLTVEGLFAEEKTLKENYLQAHSESDVDLKDNKETLEALFASIEKKAEEVDASLTGFVGAEYNKALKSIENIEKRLKKAEEKKHEVALNQLAALKDKLFPGGGLQERHDNFLNFYLNNPQFIDQLLAAFDPFDYRFHVLLEDANS